MNIEEQDRLITLAEGSVKTLFALCVADIPSNSLFIIEHMHRWLAALIEADYSRRKSLTTSTVGNVILKAISVLMKSCEKSSTARLT